MPTVAPAGTFRIPAALDVAGRLVAPEGAAARRVYRCPACEGRVDLNAGVKKRRHFHPRASTCSAESVAHLTAKLFIARATLARRLPFRIQDFPGFPHRARGVVPQRSPRADLCVWRQGAAMATPAARHRRREGGRLGRTFGRVGGRPTKALPWRRGYASACPKCGAVIGADR